MTFPPTDVLDLYAALTRARAMGFDKTADAMQIVLDEMLAQDGGFAGMPTSPTRELEKQQ